jgi:hypothetical protein
MVTSSHKVALQKFTTHNHNHSIVQSSRHTKPKTTKVVCKLPPTPTTTHQHLLTFQNQITKKKFECTLQVIANNKHPTKLLPS